MLLSSCCLASSATQDGSQHCDYLCIFKHGTLSFLKGLMYSWVAGWLPSPWPLLQGPCGCQLGTSQTCYKAGLTSGCINHPQPLQFHVNSWNSGQWAGLTAELILPQAEPLSPLFPPVLGFSENLTENKWLLFWQKNNHFLRLLTQRLMCACAGAHLQMCMPARVQAHGKNYSGCGQPESSAPTRAPLRQQSLSASLWGCVTSINLGLYTPTLAFVMWDLSTARVAPTKWKRGSVCREAGERNV